MKVLKVTLALCLLAGFVAAKDKLSPKTALCAVFEIYGSFTSQPLKTLHPIQ